MAAFPATMSGGGRQDRRTVSCRNLPAAGEWTQSCVRSGENIKLLYSIKPESNCNRGICQFAESFKFLIVYIHTYM